MWNILLTLIVLAIIFMLNPLKSTDLKPQLKLDEKKQNEVNQVVNEANSQYEYAKQMQKQQQEELGAGE